MSLETKVIPPIIDYQSITINNKNIMLSGSCKGSFIAPYNQIKIKYVPDRSLSKFIVRVTGENEDYDLDKGTRAVWQTNIPAKQVTNATIDINSSIFNLGDGKYRIGLYAQSMLDQSWDVTYLLFTVDNFKFIPADADNLEVLTARDDITE